MSQQQRIDKWLWATRVYKTRSIAADACKKGRVSIDGRNLKPSAMITVGDKIQVRKPPLTLTYQVLALTNNRVGAKLVPEYLKNITPASEYELMELQKLTSQAGRRRGTGRPTKKERRDLDRFMEISGAPDDWQYLGGDEDENDDDWADFWEES